jgi:hypothetical protein
MNYSETRITQIVTNLVVPESIGFGQPVWVIIRVGSWHSCLSLGV